MPGNVYEERLEEVYGSRSGDSDVMRENANINGDTAMGMMLRVGSEVTKEYVLSHVLPPDVAKAHREGDVHVHDMDFYPSTATCCQIDLGSVLERGFDTGHGTIRPPKTIGTAASLACIVLQSNQNEMHGGQAFPAFDWAMAPYVEASYQRNRERVRRIDARKPERAIHVLAMSMTHSDTYQAMEAFVHNLNTMHSRAGAQVPFSSVNYGTDTSWQGRMVTECLLLATRKGLGHGETPIFPVQIFKVKEGVNYSEEDPNFDLFRLACQTSAERLFPNFEFLDSPYNLQYYVEGDPNTEVATMGCRTRVMGNVRGTETTFGRGNLSFTTVNLPRIALRAAIDTCGKEYVMSHGAIDDKTRERMMARFYDDLSTTMDLVRRQLLHRYAIQTGRHVYNFPFLMGQGVWKGSERLSEEDTLESVLCEGTLSIGFIGLAEALQVLEGGNQATGHNATGLEIVRFMRNMCEVYTDEHNLNFTLLGTPAEGLAGRFVRLDRERFGEVPDVTDREYYTNSFHVPVWQDVSIYDKIDLEAPYHELCNAGHITYVEVDGDPSRNLAAFEDVVRHAKEANVGYFAVNHPLDRCPICGYQGIIYDECPKCHRKEYEAVPDEYRHMVKVGE